MGMEDYANLAFVAVQLRTEDSRAQSSGWTCPQGALAEPSSERVFSRYEQRHPGLKSARRAKPRTAL